jgi:hypothetical protein
MKKEWMWAIISLVIAIVLAYVLLSLAKDDAQSEVVVAPSKWDDQIDELERQALGEAFKKHIGQLFNIWVTDNYQPKFPPKAVVGMRNARDAYIRSMDAIERREKPPRH